MSLSRLPLLHRIVGFVFVVVFLLSGVYLGHGVPKDAFANAAVRFAYRANHIYILFAALVNLITGLYLVIHTDRWRRILQLVGSALLLFATVILLVAFAREPIQGSAKRPITTYGIFALLIGTVCHIPGRRRDG